MHIDTTSKLNRLESMIREVAALDTDDFIPDYVVVIRGQERVAEFMGLPSYDFNIQKTTKDKETGTINIIVSVKMYDFWVTIPLGKFMKLVSEKNGLDAFILIEKRDKLHRDLLYQKSVVMVLEREIYQCDSKVHYLFPPHMGYS